MNGRTKTTMGSPTNSMMAVTSANIKGNSVNTAYNNDNGNNVGVVLLTVLNATAEDSGEFWCVASNGVGDRTARNASFLLVRRKLYLRI